MSDSQITCSECGGVFVFTEAEQEFYASKGLAAPPKRCKTCRQARRAAREGGGGQAGHGGGFGRPPRRFSNDVNEYRAPMSGGAGGSGGSEGGFQGRPPRRPDRNGPPRGPGAGGPRGDRGFAPRPGGDRGFAPPRPGGDRGGFAPRPGGDRGFAPRAPGAGGGERPANGGGDYRSPSFPRARPARAEWGSGGGQAAPRARQGHEGGARPERSDAPPAQPRVARPRAERPRYDITCATCGAQAQVPFKPLEGRQVFCQACYRARKGTTAPAEAETTAVTGTDSDVGIVE